MSPPDDLVPAAHRAVRRLLAAGGLAGAPDGALARRLAVPGPVDLGELAEAARATGFEADVAEIDLEGALRRADGGEPLLARGSGAEEVWVVLLGPRSRGAHVALVREGGPEDVGPRAPGEIEAVLGLAPGEPAAWLALRRPARARGPAPGTGAEHPSPFTRLLQLFRPDRADVLAVTAFAVATGVLLLATPVAVQALVNFVAVGGAVPPLLVLTLLLALGLGLAALLGACQAWIVEMLQRRLFVRMVADLAARLPRVASRVYDRSYGPELVNRFFDVMTIQKTGSALLLDGLSIVLGVVVGLVILAFYHPLLLAFDILLLAVIAVIVLGPLRAGVRTAIAESKAKYEVAGWLEELARHPVLFRSFGARRWVERRSDAVATSYLERRREHYRVLFRQIVAALCLHALASTALLGIGGMLVIRGSLTLGQLVAAELIVSLIVVSVAKLGKHLESFYDLMAAVEKLGHLLDLPVEPDEGAAGALPWRPEGVRLELSRVGRLRDDGTPLFEPLTLALEPGSSLGVRGPSGSGKSALLELLWGLRRPDRGVIRVEGADLRDLPPHELRRAAALIADVEIASATVRENVRLGRDLVDDADVRAALQRVGLLADVEALPEGLETTLNARGWPLSEGQLRRLQVARVLVDPPRLLIVSDLFLQLSGAPRERLLETLFDREAGWTLVISSNSPDVLARCDQVLELPGGRVSPGAGGVATELEAAS